MNKKVFITMGKNTNSSQPSVIENNLSVAWLFRLLVYNSEACCMSFNQLAWVYLLLPRHGMFFYHWSVYNSFREISVLGMLM